MKCHNHLFTHFQARLYNPTVSIFDSVILPFRSRLPTQHSIPMPHIQDETYSASIADPEKFWAHQAAQLTWHKRPSSTLRRSTKKLPSGATHPHWQWFPDGEISTSFNCVDRHVRAGHGDDVAIIWDSPVTNSKETYTYQQLLDEIEALAGCLREEGVRKGDVVLVYSTFHSILFPSPQRARHRDAYMYCTF